MLKLHSRWLPLLLLSCLAVVIITPTAVAADPLDEKTLTTLIRFTDEDDVVKAIQENGIAFEIDDAVLQRLRDLNAAEAVLEAVRSAAPAPRAKPDGPPITYDAVLALVKSGVPDRVVLRSIDNSPTLFALGAAQEQELRDEGTSDAVIDALKGDRPRQSQAAARTDGKIDALAIVLDYSNSMNDETTDGKRKIDVAKQRVSALLGAIREGLDVTVLVYGHRGEPRPCQAVEVIRDLSPLTEDGRAQLIRDIQQRRAVAKTPIALALRTAGDVLATQDARCGLILISDGMETCDGDPTAEAAALANNLNVTFGRVIGFDVDDEGRDQLQATAAAMQGEYLSASSAEEFDQVIEDVQGELVHATEPPAIVRTASAISAIIVEPLTIEGFPKLEEVSVYQPGRGNPNSSVGRNRVAKIDRFGNPFPVTAGDYELWYKAKGVSYWVKLTEVTIAQQETATVTTNRFVGALSLPKPGLPGLGALEGISVYEQGHYRSPAQSATEYGAPLLVLPGKKYEVVLKLEGADPVQVANEVAVEPGRLVVIGEEQEENDPFAGAESGNE